MRLSTLSTLSLFALTALSVPLGRSNSVRRASEDESTSLLGRDNLINPDLDARSGYDFEFLELEARSKKTQTNKANKKANKQAAKAEVAKAEKKGGAAGGAAKKAEQKANAQTKHNQLKAAGAEHKKTQGLPDRNAKFNVPAGNGKPERTYTGKDVRKANFASHVKDSKGNRFGKEFNNNPHTDAGTSGTKKPLDNMNGKGHEHPLTGETTVSQKKKAHKAEPARIISQTDPKTGTHTHQGVIAHDQSRPAGHAGVNDHFEVKPKRRDIDFDDIELELQRRDEIIEDLEARLDEYEILEARSRKTQANKATKKANKAAAKQEVAKAEKKGGAAAGATKKAEQKANAQTKHNQLKAAGAEHKKTQGLPDRNDKFTVPAGNGKPERTYTGKDVRKANFGSHVKDSKGQRFGKDFNNNPHTDAGTSGTKKPLDNMTGKGHEHPLTGETSVSQKKKAHKAEPARIISQTDPATGKHTHQGVIAHDQSRPVGDPGVNDHFKVNPVKSVGAAVDDLTSLF